MQDFPQIPKHALISPVWDFATPPTGLTYSYNKALWWKSGGRVFIDGYVRLSAEGSGGAGAAWIDFAGLGLPAIVDPDLANPGFIEPVVFAGLINVAFPANAVGVIWYWYTDFTLSPYWIFSTGAASTQLTYAELISGTNGTATFSFNYPTPE